MKPDELPLLELFTRLRQAGLPLGTTEYQLVLKALQSGFGIPDRQALARLCSTLWVKSKEDQLLFNYHFEQVMAEDESNLVSAVDSQQLPQPFLAISETDLPKISFISWWRRVSLPMRLALGGVMVLCTGIFLWSVRPKCPYFISTPVKEVQKGEQYDYPIKVCQANAEEKNLKIKALVMPPWMDFYDNEDGTARLWTSPENIERIDDVYGMVYLWSLQDQEQLAQFPHDAPVMKTSFNADGDQLATVTDDGTISLWKLKDQKLLGEFSHPDNILSASFNADGDQLVTVTDDGKIRILDLSEVSSVDADLILQEEGELELDGKELRDRNTPYELYSGYFEGKEGQTIDIRLDVNSRNLFIIELILKDENGRTLNSMESNSGRIYSSNPYSYLSPVLPQNGRYRIIANIRSSDEQATGSYNLAVTSYSDYRTISQDLGKVKAVKYSPNRQRLAAVADDGTISLWNLKSQGPSANIPHPIAEIPHPANVLSVNFSSDGQQLTTITNDGIVRVLNLSETISVETLLQANGDLNPEGRKWLPVRNTLYGEYFEGKEGQTIDIRLDVNSDYFVDNYLSLSLEDEHGQTLKKSKGYIEDPYLSTFLSPQISTLLPQNGSYRVILTANYTNSKVEGSYDLAVNLYPNYRAISQNLGEDNIDKVNPDRQQLNPNGQQLATVANYKQVKQIKLLDLEGRELFQFSPPGEVNFNTVGFSPDGQQLVAGGATKSIVLKVTDLANNNSVVTQTFNLIDDESVDAYLEALYNLLLRLALIYSLLITVMFAGYFIVRWITERKAKSPGFVSLPEIDEEPPTAISSLNQGFKDEMQVAQAVQQRTHKDTDLSLDAFAETNEYFPLTGRQMKQSWRYLRRLIREGPSIELDMEATVNQVSRSGMLLHPVLRSRRVNRNELLLLVDQEGSMVPFHALSERLTRTAINGGRLAKTGIYYFHNCPDQYLYHDPYCQDAEPISEILSSLHPEYTGVLIFSDAGAARGAFNRERLELTITFLDQLQQQLRYFAWLNPMPRKRWTGTAEEIAKRVPMFELSRQGLNEAIDVLLGKPTHQIV